MTASRQAALSANALTRDLLVASAITATNEERRAAVERAFRTWPLLCRHMSEIERLAPVEAADGYEFADMVLAIKERAA